MRTRELGPTVEAKSSDPQKAVGRIGNEEAFAAPSDYSPRLVSQPGRVPIPHTHAARLSRFRHFQPRSAGNYLLQLQRRYGNRYVQRVRNLSRWGKENAAAISEVEKAIQSRSGLAVVGGRTAASRALDAHAYAAAGTSAGAIQRHEIERVGRALPLIQRAGFTPPKTSKLPASPAPWHDVWVGGDAQGVVFEVVRDGIPVRVLRKYGQLGIKGWRTLVCEHNAWPDPPDLRTRMEAAAAAVATQNPRVLPEPAAAHRVALVVFADAETAYYAHKKRGAIVFRIDFNPGDYNGAVVHELSHGLFEFHRVGATPGSENAAPDEVLLGVELLYEELAKTANVPIPTEKFDPNKPPPFADGAEQKPAGLVMFTDVLWSGSGGHPWDDAHELYASAYAGNLQAPKLLKEIIAHYQKADPAIAPLAKKMFQILAMGATRKTGAATGTHVSPIEELITDDTTAQVGWAAEPETMYQPVTESTFCISTEKPELDF